MEKKVFVIFLVGSLMFLSMVSSVTSQQNPILVDDKELEEPPEKPTIAGPSTSKVGVRCEYRIRSVDPQNDDIYYEIKCSDCPVAHIVKTCCCCSGEEILFTHCWDDFYQKNNPFVIKARAIDIHGHESEWETFNVEITINAKNAYPFLNRFFQNYPVIYQLLTRLMNIVK